MPSVAVEKLSQVASSCDVTTMSAGLRLCRKLNDRKPTIQKNLEVHQEEGVEQRDASLTQSRCVSDDSCNYDEQAKLYSDIFHF